ncbi:MAG TPA: AIPR family protein [Thermoanaerobaculia bacterium]|jgi:hypothetical protein|nr:AIPR family protein [Thermoanaerobaculia bacterium]
MAQQSLTRYISQRVEHYTQFYRLNKTGKAFMLWYAVEALDLDQDAAFEAVSYDGGNDKSIDLFFIDEAYQRIIIGQGKYQKNGRYSPKTGEFLELLHTIDWLSDPEALAREGRDDLAGAAQDYLDAVARGFSLTFEFVYMGPPKKELADQAALFTKSESGNFPSRSARILDLDLLQHAHDEYIDKSTRIAEEMINVTDGQHFEQRGAFGRAIVVTVPGVELKRLYDLHQYSLFDRNVRLFLGARKGSVNAGLRDTLNSPAERKNFWAYNNGMTFVCDSFDFDEATAALTMTNFSVVNGCQTTVSVATASAAAIKEVSVLARVIASPQKTVVDSVITYTNRQTPIQPWDISSQDKTQKRLKKEFAEEPQSFFYVLRRGEQARLNAAEKRNSREMARFRLYRWTYWLSTWGPSMASRS